MTIAFSVTVCSMPIGGANPSVLGVLASPALREAEQARATLDVSARILGGMQLGFYSAETRVRGHITRLNPELAEGIKDLVAVLDADRANIASALSAGAGEIAPAAFNDVSPDVERLKGQIDGDIARLEGQSVAEALKELEAERVLLLHRQVLSQLLPQIETSWAEARWVKTAAGAPRRSLNPRHLTEKETELFRTVIAVLQRSAGQEMPALDCPLPVESSARGERGQTIRSLVIKGGHPPNEILSEGEHPLWRWRISSRKSATTPRMPASCLMIQSTHRIISERNASPNDW